MQDVLLRQIEARPNLRHVFFLLTGSSSSSRRDGQKGDDRVMLTASLYCHAVAIYKAYV
jgi:hypothetical protein